jgi:hypothetical protein
MECDRLMELTENEKNDIICELRGIAQEIDIEFEQMVLYNKISRNRLEQIESHLNNILGLLVMYHSVIKILET